MIKWMISVLDAKSECKELSDFVKAYQTEDQNWILFCKDYLR